MKSVIGHESWKPQEKDILYKCLIHRDEPSPEKDMTFRLTLRGR